MLLDLNESPTPSSLKRSVNKCRNQECLSLLHAALRDGPRGSVQSEPSGRSTSDRIRNRIRTMSNPLKSIRTGTTVYGSTGSTGESSTSEGNPSEDASQRLRGSGITTQSSTHSSSTFTSRFSHMTSSFSSVRRKKSRPSPSGRTLLPNKSTRRHLADTMESSFQCSSVGPKNIIVELFNDSAQIEFSEGSLRCSTILYAKIIKSGDEQIQKFFKMKDNINFPSSSQLWAKPISIEIPGKFPLNSNPTQILPNAGPKIKFLFQDRLVNSYSQHVWIFDVPSSFPELTFESFDFHLVTGRKPISSHVISSKIIKLLIWVSKQPSSVFSLSSVAREDQFKPSEQEKSNKLVSVNSNSGLVMISMALD